MSKKSLLDTQMTNLAEEIKTVISESTIAELNEAAEETRLDINQDKFLIGMAQTIGMATTLFIVGNLIGAPSNVTNLVASTFGSFIFVPSSLSYFWNKIAIPYQHKRNPAVLFTKNLEKVHEKLMKK